MRSIRLMFAAAAAPAVAVAAPSIGPPGFPGLPSAGFVARLGGELAELLLGRLISQVRPEPVNLLNALAGPVALSRRDQIPSRRQPRIVPGRRGDLLEHGQPRPVFGGIRRG